MSEAATKLLEASAAAILSAPFPTATPADAGLM